MFEQITQFVEDDTDFCHVPLEIAFMQIRMQRCKYILFMRENRIPEFLQRNFSCGNTKHAPL